MCNKTSKKELFEVLSELFLEPIGEEHFNCIDSAIRKGLNAEVLILLHKHNERQSFLSILSSWKVLLESIQKETIQKMAV